jgi:hypothetical protein
MSPKVTLTITSLLSILFMAFHLTDDIVRGIEPGGGSTLVGVLILVVWLYGTLVLAGRRSGYVIILIGSILGSAVPVVHMMGAGLVGGRIANSSGVFFWVWTLMALGVTAIFSVILSARGLWSAASGRAQVSMRREPIDMNDVSTLRLYLLRGMYLLIAVGLATTVWPHIVSPPDLAAGPKSVIRALLGALAVMSLLGLRYPLQMLPLLLFELLWKVIWVIASAARMWLGPGLDEYASETLFACLMGVVLVPIVVPWGHVIERYARAPGEPWSGRARAHSSQSAA